jgi:hypothetical protein
MLLSGPVPDLPLVSAIKPPLEACENDGLQVGYCTDGAGAGNEHASDSRKLKLNQYPFDRSWNVSHFIDNATMERNL